MLEIILGVFFSGSFGSVLKHLMYRVWSHEIEEFTLLSISSTICAHFKSFLAICIQKYAGKELVKYITKYTCKNKPLFFKIQKKLEFP